MMRRTELKRSPFKRRELAQTAHQDRKQRLAERAARQMACATPSPDNVSMAANDQQFCSPVEKEELLRSEPYRRLVAAGACKSCSIEGYSQHAHENEGKGAGLKTDDRTCFPLCCDRPGVKGCHPRYDQYELYPKHAAAVVAEAWGADTRRRIEMMNLWPAGLPKWPAADTALQY